MSYTDAQIAQVCHEANRALQQIHVTAGDRSIAVAPPWWQLDEPTRLRNIAGVAAARRGASPEQLHQEWCDALIAEGWQFGKIKNPETRRHPCLVSYDQLPGKQRHKDEVFAAIVAALAPDVMTNERAEQIREQFLGPRIPAVSGQLDSENTRAALGTYETVLSPAMQEQLRPPRVADVVHYVAHGTPVQADGSQAFPPACRAAMVTEVNDDGNVGLFVANPTGVFLHAADHDTGQAHTWHWTDAGKPQPPALCDGMAHAGGTWHWPA